MARNATSDTCILAQLVMAAFDIEQLVAHVLVTSDIDLYNE